MGTVTACKAWALPLNDLHRPQALDFLRVLAIGIVGWFHIWQQSWVGAGKLTFLPRTGYVWVDMMILLSALCLCLPYAHARAAGQPFPGCSGFFKRRAARILPGYVFTVLVCFGVSLAQNGSGKDLWLDLAAHLTLTHTFFYKSYLYCKINSALWTVGVLALFYLLFPLLIRAFFKRPWVTVVSLMALQAFYSWGYALRLDPASARYSASFNQLPGFLGVIGLGFAGAWAIAVWGRLRPKKAAPLFTLVGLGMLFAAAILLRTSLQQAQHIQQWQLAFRLPLSGLFCLAAVGLCLGVRAPGQHIWRFLSGISYCYYMWHQWVAVQVKYHLRVPPWQGHVPPNQLGDQVWMHQYQAIAVIAGVLAAVFVTYGVEKPCLRLLKRIGRPGHAAKRKRKYPAGLA